MTYKCIDASAGDSACNPCICMYWAYDRQKICVMKALGFDWLKNQRSVIFIMSDQKDVKGQSLCKTLMCLIGLKIFD